VFHCFKNEITFDFGPNISGKKVKPFFPAGTEHHLHWWWGLNVETFAKRPFLPNL
jgi:hypothetical protein